MIGYMMGINLRSIELKTTPSPNQFIIDIKKLKHGKFNRIIITGLDTSEKLLDVEKAAFAQDIGWSSSKFNFIPFDSHYKYIVLSRSNMIKSEDYEPKYYGDNCETYTYDRFKKEMDK